MTNANLAEAYCILTRLCHLANPNPQGFPKKIPACYKHPGLNGELYCEKLTALSPTLIIYMHCNGYPETTYMDKINYANAVRVSGMESMLNLSTASKQAGVSRDS